MGDLDVGDGQNGLAGVGIFRVGNHNGTGSPRLDAVVHIRGGSQGTLVGCRTVVLSIVDSVAHLIACSGLQADLDIRNNICICLIQVEGHSLTGGQVELIVGAVADIVGNAEIRIIAVNEDGSIQFLVGTGNNDLTLIILGDSIVGSRNDIVSQLLVDRPCLAVLNVGAVHNTDDTAISLLTGNNTGRIVDPDGIQIQIVAVLASILVLRIGLVHVAVVGRGDGDIVGAVGQALDLDHRNLPQSAGIIEGHSAILFHTVVGIDQGISDEVTLSIGNTDQQTAGGAGGHGDHIEAGAAEAEVCGSVGIGIHMDHCHTVEGIGGVVGISQIGAIDVVGIDGGQVVHAGTVLALGHFRTLGDGPAKVSIIRRVGGSAVVLHGIQGQEALLVIDGGGGNHRHSTVIVLLGLLVGGLIGGLIAEPVIAAHLHILGGIADLGADDLGIAVGTAVVCFTERSIGLICGDPAHIGAYTLQSAGVAQHIIFQNGDIHGKAVVHHNGVIHGADGPHHCEVHGGIVVAVAVAVGAVVLGVFVGTLVAGDIGGRHLGGIAVDDPSAAAGAGVDGDLIAGGIVKHGVAIGQNAAVDGVKADLTAALLIVQQNGLVGHRLGDLVGSQEVCRGIAVSIQRLTGMTVHQVERIADPSGSPAGNGRGNRLGNLVAHPVDITQSRVVIGGIGACGNALLHGTIQVDHVGQGVLLFVDGADVPHKGLGSDLNIAHLLSDRSSIVVEILGADHTIFIQDVLFGHLVGSRHGTVFIEGNDLDGILVAVGLAHILFGAVAGLSIGGSVDVGDADGDAGIHIWPLYGVVVLILCAGIHGGSPLQVEVVTHLILEHRFGCGIGDAEGDAAERSIQLIGIANIGVIVALAGRNGLDQILGDINGDLSIFLQAEADGVEFGAQALALLHIGRSIARCVRHDHIVGLVGRSLDSLGKAVGMAGAVTVVEVAVILGRSVLAVSSLKGIGIGPGTLQPVDPAHILVTTVTLVKAVVTEGAAVGQEDDKLLTVLGVGSLLGSQQIVGISQSAVIVGAAVQ